MKKFIADFNETVCELYSEDCDDAYCVVEIRQDLNPEINLDEVLIGEEIEAVSVDEVDVISGVFFKGLKRYGMFNSDYGIKYDWSYNVSFKENRQKSLEIVEKAYGKKFVDGIIKE